MSITTTILSPYQEKIESAIVENIPFLGPRSVLRDACEYALTAGGKRVRPSLVLMMAKALGFGADVIHAALSIEFFHTASLVADDMPSMDDDEERRGLPSVHKKFGESVALLASYALISAGYERLANNGEAIKRSGLPFAAEADRRTVLALENATCNTGLMGATGGQFLDIAPPDLSPATLRETIHKKTSTLFEISFVYGWLFGGGDIAKLDVVKRAAAHFGMAFQIADDLGDMVQDTENQRLVNMANVLGEEGARKMFHEEHQQFLLTIKALSVPADEFEATIALLS